MEIPLFCPYFKRREMHGVLECLVSDTIGANEQLNKFLELVKEKLHCDHVIAVRSAWNALWIALDSLALSDGSSVALPALAPSWQINVLESAGFKPVILDHDPETGQIKPESMPDNAAKPQAMIIDDLLGIMPDPVDIAAQGIPIVEDMSQAFGAFRDGIKAGSNGTLTVLGLENSGLLAAGGGALIFSTSKRTTQVLRNRTISIPDNLVMTDMSAALGFARMKELDMTIQKRRELYRLFAQSVAISRHALLVQEGDGEPGYFAFPVLVNGSVKEVQAYAKKKDIETGLAFSDSIVTRFPEKTAHCPGARSLSLRTLLFPVHQRIGVEDASKISRVLSTLP